MKSWKKILITYVTNERTYTPKISLTLRAKITKIPIGNREKYDQTFLKDIKMTLK